ncbi:MAG: hypothetical protein WD648_16400 [Planctomycetaceae bacterium]
MADYQRIIDDIRNILSVPKPALSDALRQAADDYSSACREVNDRLRRCGEYLRQHLWCEAVHIAELEPKLIESVSVLDFMEREAFIELTQAHEQTQAPQLMIDVAEELQEAYGRYAAIEKPLARLRVLNLKRASGSRRLAVMRELQRRDAGVPFWDDDIIGLERQSFQEIERQASSDARRLDVNALDRSLDELSQNQWRERPPASLLKKISSLRRSVVERTATSKLPRLTQELVAHFNEHRAHFQNSSAPALANDAVWITATQLYDQWYTHAEKAELLENDPMYQTAEPVLAEIQRIRNEQQHDQNRRESLGQFEDALTRPDMTRFKLQGLRRVAARWALVPTDVDQKFGRKMKQLWWKENWEKVVGAAMFLIVVGAFVFFILVVKK